MEEVPRNEACQVCGREGAVFHGRVKVPPGRIIEVWKCPKSMKYDCLQLALDKQRIETKEKREKEYEEAKKKGSFRVP